jgi:hypothetical protein
LAFDGLAVEDMIGEVREKKKKKKKKTGGVHEGEAGREGEAGWVFCSHFKLVYFFLDVEVSNCEWKAKKIPLFAPTVWQLLSYVYVFFQQG